MDELNTMPPADVIPEGAPESVPEVAPEVVEEPADATKVVMQDGVPLVVPAEFEPSVQTPRQEGDQANETVQ